MSESPYRPLLANHTAHIYGKLSHVTTILVLSISFFLPLSLSHLKSTIQYTYILYRLFAINIVLCQRCLFLHITNNFVCIAYFVISFNTRIFTYGCCMSCAYFGRRILGPNILLLVCSGDLFSVLRTYLVMLI